MTWTWIDLRTVFCFYWAKYCFKEINFFKAYTSCWCHSFSNLFIFNLNSWYHSTPRLIIVLFFAIRSLHYSVNKWEVRPNWLIKTADVSRPCCNRPICSSVAPLRSGVCFPTTRRCPGVYWRLSFIRRKIFSVWRFGGLAGRLAGWRLVQGARRRHPFSVQIQQAQEIGPMLS